MDSRLEELKRAVESAVEGLSNDQLSWHPADKWCAAEVLEHLYLTYTGTIKGFAKVLEAGKPLVTRASMKQRMRTLVVVGFQHMPEGRQAPANTRPKGLPGAKVRSEVGAKIAEMDAIIAQCEARFGRGRRVLDHPILGPLTATQWRKFHFVHGQHHVKQLVRLRRSMGSMA
ncbi:MAG: DinB family protein [Candidatus Sulfotelmatobacter sp.]